MSPDQRDPSALLPERHAAFEERIRQRVIERCLAAARAALGDGRFDDAEASLAEAAGLDPAQTDVRALSAELAERRREAAARQPRTRWWPIAVAILAVVVVPTSIDRLAPILPPSDQLVVPAAPPSAVGTWVPASAGLTPIDAPASPAADAAALPDTAPRSITSVTEPVKAVERAVNEVARLPEPSPRQTVAADSDADLDVRSLSSSARDSATYSAAGPTVPSTDVVAPLAVPVRPVDDRLLVDRAIERYRSAYDRLDAGLAQAVYPGVDRLALSRAFDALSSQSLVFDGCDIEIRGALANVTCRGTASYVPKVGSAEPRIEGRVWTFTLRRGADDWTIERARVTR